MNEWMNEWTYAKHSSNKKCHKFKRSRLMRLFKTGRQLTPTWKGWEQQVPLHTVREHAEGKQWLRRDFIQTELPDTSPTKPLLRLTRHIAAKQMGNPFWAITQRVVVIPFGRFKTTYRSHLQGSRNPPPKKKPVTLVRGLYREERRR